MVKKIKHTSALPSHYDAEAATYDSFNEKNNRIINKTIEKICREQRVKTILDMSCGTGSQVFWLAQKGYAITGIDINKKMLTIARNKAADQRRNLNFLEGDMRTTQQGPVDAVITIFNSIGHLTKEDFEVTLANINKNLHKNGIYIFDIFNLDYLLYGKNITKLTIDWLEKTATGSTREIQYSTIDTDGILTSYDTYVVQDGTLPLRISHVEQTLQVYRASELTQLIKKHGFRLLYHTTIDGSTFDKQKTERILTIAQKQ